MRTGPLLGYLKISALEFGVPAAHGQKLGDWGRSARNPFVIAKLTLFREILKPVCRLRLLDIHFFSQLIDVRKNLLYSLVRRQNR